MKKIFIFISIMVLLFISACFPENSAPVLETSTQEPILKPTKIVSTSTNLPITADANSIQPFQDVRGRRLTSLEQAFDESLILTLKFNTYTKWPESVDATAQRIFQAGMNPGLGVRALHEEGINGEGVTVAIIDQTLFLDHPEFTHKIIEYQEFAKSTASAASYHGPAVTSLLVGENTGTAPGARIYYVAAGAQDAQSYGDALNWIIDKNSQLPDGEKIRAVSVSTVTSGPGTPFTKNLDLWRTAVERANDAGILVIDCATDQGIVAPCTLDIDHPDDPSRCTPGLPIIDNYYPDPSRIHVPVSRRTFAAESYKGINYYQYIGLGGISWSAPYLTGVLALGWQINPQLTNEQILDILFETAIKQDGAKIINPPAFIEAIKKTQ
ncbi:MAG: hypothetical protein JEZ00_19795 [Anaerolineaceae bacterium]|nr:hypothetical protein [Anaerolineaceae bacterium]